jgi:hypothetical protein
MTTALSTWRPVSGGMSRHYMPSSTALGAKIAYIKERDRLGDLKTSVEQKLYRDRVYTYNPDLDYRFGTDGLYWTYAKPV